MDDIDLAMAAAMEEDRREDPHTWLQLGAEQFVRENTYLAAQLLIALETRLAAMTAERDALKERLQKIGRQAFWSSRNGA